MLSVQNLSLHFGDRTLFDAISFTIKAGERVALIGRNGTGKTTLFRLLSGEMQPDGGQVDWPNDWQVGYLSQDIRPVREETVWEVALQAFANARAVAEELQAIEDQLTHQPPEGKALEVLLSRMEECHHLLAVQEWDQAEGAAEKVLRGLGFRPSEFHRPLHTFSGGWQVRVWLAKLLLERPQMMLLDEPTNHLDIESILWLEQYLRTSDMALLVVSHDQRFLRRTTSRVMELQFGRLDDYPVPYDKYLVERQLREQQRKEAAEAQQRRINQMQTTIDRFRAKATKAKMAKSMEKQLAKMELVPEAEQDAAAMRVRFPDPPRSGRIVFGARHLAKSYGENQVLKDVELHIERGERVAFIGQNGQGKTTLARIIHRELAPDQGEIEDVHQVKIGYYAQDQSERLEGKRSVLQTLEEEAGPEMRPKVRTILGTFLFSGEDVEKKVSVLSGGEWARLALAKLMLRPVNFLILDEPTNHLDVPAKAVLKEALLAYQGTLLVVSHDREFLSGLCDKLHYFKDGQIRPFLGDIDDFLAQYDLRDERLLAQRSTGAPAAESSDNKQRTPEWQEARKQARRAVQKWEREIERIENEIQRLEDRMAKPDFYASTAAERTLAEHRDLKEKADQAMMAWEEAMVAWEPFEGT